MTDYKQIASAWVNDSKKGDGKYLSIKNTSDEDIVIRPGQSFFMNMTPKSVREKHPGVPMFSKSEKIEGQVTDTDEIVNDIPF